MTVSKNDKPESAEVVAWRYQHNGKWVYTETPQREVERAHGFEPAQPLYTAPPRPQASAHVGVLSDDEVFKLAEASHYGSGPNSYWDMDRTALLAFARALTRQHVAGATSVAVDEAMVERAVEAYWQDCANPNTYYTDSAAADRGHMRAALTAALAGQSLKNESDQEQQGGPQE